MLEKCLEENQDDLSKSIASEPVDRPSRDKRGFNENNNDKFKTLERFSFEIT